MVNQLSAEVLPHVLMAYTTSMYEHTQNPRTRGDIPRRTSHSCLSSLLWVGHLPRSPKPQTITHSWFVTTPSIHIPLLCAQLVVAVLCDISYPRQRLVATLLDDLQIAHLHTKWWQESQCHLHTKWWQESNLRNTGTIEAIYRSLWYVFIKWHLTKLVA